jgi:hydrogenase-4 component F
MAMTGSPPFLPFASEFAFFSAAFSHGHIITGSLMALMLMLAFLGMALTVVPVVFGDPPKKRERTKYRDSGLLVLPPLALLVVLGILGLWLPQPLYKLVTEAAQLLEGGR